MTPEAIVYTSNTGYTWQYAQMLGEKTGLPIYALEEAASRLPGGSPILYLGWVRASRVQGFSRASKLFSVCAVGAVGLCPAGTQTDVVRQASSIPEDMPLFTLQGGFARSRLKGVDKLMTAMLTKGLAARKQRSPQEEQMLCLLQKDGSYICADALNGMLQWYREQQPHGRTTI